MRDIRAVFFDVDDTLVDHDTAARRSFAAALGPDVDYGHWLSLDHYDRFLRGELDFQTMRETRMADFLAMLDRDDDPVDIEHRRFSGLADQYTLFHDVLPCLDGLRARRFTLGLITNNESAHQRAKIAKFELAEWFPVIVISGEVGVAKPDAAIFTLACDLAGVRPEQAMHVVADAYGACDAGLHGVLLDRRGSHSRANVPIVSNLSEVASLLGDVSPCDRDTPPECR